jgi:hypothetical protein
MWKNIQDSKEELAKMLEKPAIEIAPQTPKDPPRIHRAWRKGSAVTLLSQARVVAANRNNLRGTEAREAFCNQSNITLHDLSMLTRVGLDNRLFKMRDVLPSKFHLIYKLSLLSDAQLEAIRPKIYPGLRNSELEQAIASVSNVETVILPAKAPAATPAPVKAAKLARDSNIVKVWRNPKSPSSQLRIPVHIAKLIPENQHFEVTIDDLGLHFTPCAPPVETTIEEEVPAWCKP